MPAVRRQKESRKVVRPALDGWRRLLAVLGVRKDERDRA
jgi:hypothetical protein